MVLHGNTTGLQRKKKTPEADKGRLEQASGNRGTDGDRIILPHRWFKIHLCGSDSYTCLVMRVFSKEPIALHTSHTFGRFS